MDAREGLRHVLPARRPARARVASSATAAGLRVVQRLNGEVLQDGNTRDLIFAVPFLVAYVSNVFTLEPGDLILTGTPPGVGWARDPKVSLQAGDVVEVEVEGIGVLSNPVVGCRDGAPAAPAVRASSRARSCRCRRASTRGSRTSSAGRCARR